MTCCVPCRRGDHAHCEEIVPRALDELDRPIEGAGFTDCRCLCDVRERTVDHLQRAIAAANAGDLAEAQRHTEAARELLGPEEPLVGATVQRKPRFVRVIRLDSRRAGKTRGAAP